jgi:hypothetical protein
MFPLPAKTAERLAENGTPAGGESNFPNNRLKITPLFGMFSADLQDDITVQGIAVDQAGRGPERR